MPCFYSERLFSLPPFFQNFLPFSFVFSYCNSRILKFSREGDLIRKWGRKNRGMVQLDGSTSISFTIENSIGVLLSNGFPLCRPEPGHSEDLRAIPEILLITESLLTR